MKRRHRAVDAADLRRRAEQRLAGWPSDGAADASASIRQLHELTVHQVELEMQNEALLQAHAETEQALQQLVELNGSLETLVATRTAELVAARDAAEAASRAKSRFLSNMSHELRTPLSGVIGMIDLALGSATDAKQANWLHAAKTSGEHLLAVVNDVLDLSKLDAGRLTLHSSSFSLGLLLDQLRFFFAPCAESKGLAFSCELPAGLASQNLQGDSFRLKQILLNLLGNAFKFTSAGGVVLRVLVAQESAAQLLLRFEVRDSGIGISPEAQARLFRPFEQADDSTTRRYGGTGLGLVISDRLVRMMGGSIGATSVPDVGSTFWFTAGFARTDAELGMAPQPLRRFSIEHAGLAGVRVLLAEDDPTNQAVAVAMLESAGVGVDMAADGAVAVAMARATPYALILLDMHMPVMGGEDACRAIRQIPGHARTPILALTASVLEEDRQRCLDAGMDDHLSKPILPEQLFGALLKWLVPPR